MPSTWYERTGWSPKTMSAGRTGLGNFQWQNLLSFLEPRQSLKSDLARIPDIRLIDLK